jgi:threonine dehydratase
MPQAVVPRPPTPEELQHAREVVARHLVATPVVKTSLSDAAWLKLETLQPTGSFKVRGALAATAAQAPGTQIVTASAGNHGLGMAFAAKALDREVTVVVPAEVSPAKVAALRATSVKLIQWGDECHEAEAYGRNLASEGGVYISPYNDPHVIAGQSTIGAELDAQLGDSPLTVVCGVGGGGLCSGLTLWAASRSGTKVIGVEAAASLAVSTAIRRDQVVDIEIGDSLADGLIGQIDNPSINWQILRDYGTQLVAVDENEIRHAMQWLFANHGVVVEAAGAVGVAAVLAGKLSIEGTLAVVLSGKNVTAERYAQVITGA